MLLLCIGDFLFAKFNNIELKDIFPENHNERYFRDWKEPLQIIVDAQHHLFQGHIQDLINSNPFSR